MNLDAAKGCMVVLDTEPKTLAPQEALRVEVRRDNFDEIAVACGFDPRQASMSDVRSEIAAVRIPLFVSTLLDKMHSGDELTGREVELLYSEYRQYFRSNSPFKESLQRTVGSSPGSSGHDAHLLRQLVHPANVHKRTAHYFLRSLMKARVPAFKYPALKV